MNGPNSGKDVFIPMDWVIGGREYAGQGWRMLMECLAAGRSISLPSSSGRRRQACGAHYQRVQQGAHPVQDLHRQIRGHRGSAARIAGNTYAIDAARTMTAGPIDLGEKPSVISAIVKYHCTERGAPGGQRCDGRAWRQGHLPRAEQLSGPRLSAGSIGITVEGANILTRSMMIFGQGAIRCHPYVLREIAATRNADPRQAGNEFDDAVWAHVRLVSCCNAARSLWQGVSRAQLGSRRAWCSGVAISYTRQLTRLSAGFAFAADVAMLFLGGDLKRREKLSARLGDILSQLYMRPRF